MVRKERISGFALLLFGICFLLYSSRYPLDTWSNPGPAAFPLAGGAILLILVVVELCRNSLNCACGGKKQKEERASLKEDVRKEGGKAKMLAMVLVFILYILMISWIGFFISNFFFIIIASRLTGARHWGAPVALSLGINLFCYFLFEFWLKLSFPRGILF